MNDVINLSTILPPRLCIPLFGSPLFWTPVPQEFLVQGNSVHIPGESLSPFPYFTRDSSWGIPFLGNSLFVCAPTLGYWWLWVLAGTKNRCSYFLGRYIPHGRKKIYTNSSKMEQIDNGWVCLLRTMWALSSSSRSARRWWLEVVVVAVDGGYGGRKKHVRNLFWGNGTENTARRVSSWQLWTDKTRFAV